MIKESEILHIILAIIVLFVVIGFGAILNLDTIGLGLAILFLLLVLFVEFIRENVFYSILVLFAIYLGIYWKTTDRYEKYDVYFILLLLIVFIASRLIFRNLDQATLTLRVSSILAFVLLNVVLLIELLLYLDFYIQV